MSLEPRLSARLADRQAQMLARLGELVRIESGSHDKAGVDRVGEWMSRELEAAGMRVERLRQEAFGDQLVARCSWGGRGRGLILGHLDTVWPTGTLAGWPFEVDEDGCAHGPGAGDMKGGLVVALEAIEALQASGLCRLGSLVFVLVPDEELGTPHSRPLIEAEARAADWAFVMEPGRENGGVVTSRSVVGKFTLRAEGRSAHAGVDYERGASAVRELALKVPALEGLTRLQDGLVVNVGVFRGGEARQVVPAQAEMLVDFRAPDAQEAQRLMERIRAIALAARDPRVALSAEGVQTRPAFPRSEGTVRLYELAAGVAGELGLQLPEVHTRGGSDGSLVAALGVPTLDGMGPVSLDDCSRRERVRVDTLVPRALLLANLILALDRQSNGEA